eukprot:scaffold28_cov73-Cylindrotheca_fusiformis.AAC.2
MAKKNPTNQQQSAPPTPPPTNEEAEEATTTATTTPAEEAAEASNQVDSGNPVMDPTETVLDSSPDATNTTTTTNGGRSSTDTTRSCPGAHGCDYLKPSDIVGDGNGVLVMNNHDAAMNFLAKFTKSITTDDTMKFSGFKTFKEAMSLMLRQIQLGHIELSYQEGKDDDDEDGASSSSTRTASKYESPTRILDAIRALLLFFGTNFILEADDEKHKNKTQHDHASQDYENDRDPLLSARYMAQAVAYLEKTYFYEKKNTRYVSKKRMKKDEIAHMRDMNDPSELFMVSFYARRIPCSCLDKIYADLKAQQKMGRCSRCKEMKLSSDLKLCGGCRFRHYCSRDCQRADWKEGNHKGECSIIWDYLYDRTYKPEYNIP